MSPFDASTSGAEVVATFPNAVEGKAFVITGPSEGGLGAQTAIFLAHGHPSSIFLLGRNQSKAISVINSIQSLSPTSRVEFVNIGLASFASIRVAVEFINNSVAKIDVLINNAGIMGIKDYTLTKDGLESQFGCNHIGHFLLTNLLMPKILAAGKGARVVNLSSVSHQTHEMRFDDYNFENGKAYDPWLAYGQSKTANILFTAELAEKLKGRGILSFAVHPGTIMTNLASEIDPSEWGKVQKLYSDRGYEPPKFDRDQAQGTAGTLVAALDPELEKFPGAYISDCAVAETPDYAPSLALAARLWVLSEEIVGEIRILIPRSFQSSITRSGWLWCQ